MKAKEAGLIGGAAMGSFLPYLDFALRTRPRWPQAASNEPKKAYITGNELAIDVALDISGDITIIRSVMFSKPLDSSQYMEVKGR
jgi:hypothetical protein